jgi:hypothetical protein
MLVTSRLIGVSAVLSARLTALLFVTTPQEQLTLAVKLVDSNAVPLAWHT